MDKPQKEMLTHFYQAICSYNILSKHLEFHSPNAHRIITPTTYSSQWGCSLQKCLQLEGKFMPTHKLEINF